MTQTVFISYSHKNEYIARRLHLDLKRAGLESPWIDRLSIPIHSEWMKQIERGIMDQEVFVCLWSPEAAKSPNVKDEYELAKKHSRSIAIFSVAGKMESDQTIGPLQNIDSAGDYEKGLSSLLTRVFAIPPESLQSPFELVRSGTTVASANATLGIKSPESWRIGNRTFLKLPILPSAYSNSSFIVDAEGDLKVGSDVQVVLKYTDDDRRDAVREVLQFLVEDGQNPRLLLVEGPKWKDHSYYLPEEQHVWADAIKLIADVVKEFSAMCDTLHFFLHIPVALGFCIPAAIRNFPNCRVYHHQKDEPIGQRYRCIFPVPAGEKLVGPQPR